MFMIVKLFESVYTEICMDATEKLEISETKAQALLGESGGMPLLKICLKNN